ncbi:MAG: molybdopterin dinucleotide binding domain-containing protein [Candidatus Eisenbacteria bacterium]
MEASGLTWPDIESFARMWSDARAVTTLVGPSALATPAGSQIARAVAQLHRATGHWGGSGKSVFVLPRGANVGGVLAAGVGPGRLPGSRRLTDGDHRAEVGSTWGVDPGALPSTSGMSCLEWPAAILADRIGALVAVGTNPAADLPAAEHWREALTRSFFILGSSHAATESEPFADVVLPLALVAGETQGTMISLDRRHQLLEQAVPPPGEARTTSAVLLALARAHLGDARYERELGTFDRDPLATTEQARRLLAGTPQDMSGITIDRLRVTLGICWPSVSPVDPGIDRFGPSTATRPRLAPDGTALPLPTVLSPAPFVPTPSPAVPSRDAQHPFLLVSGPMREHFRSRVRTGATPALHYQAPSPRIEMHPNDAAGLAVQDGDWVTLTSDTGELTAQLWLVDRCQPGTLFVPEHFGFWSDVQGGSDTMDAPEGLFYLVADDDVMSETGAPSGLIVPVAVKPARRREMRRRALKGSKSSG